MAGSNFWQQCVTQGAELCMGYPPLTCLCTIVFFSVIPVDSVRD